MLFKKTFDEVNNLFIKHNVGSNPSYIIQNGRFFYFYDKNGRFFYFYENTKTIKTASSSQARQPINKTGLKTFEPFKDYLKEISEILQN